MEKQWTVTTGEHGEFLLNGKTVLFGTNHDLPSPAVKAWLEKTTPCEYADHDTEDQDAGIIFYPEHLDLYYVIGAEHETKKKLETGDFADCDCLQFHGIDACTVVETDTCILIDLDGLSQHR